MSTAISRSQFLRGDITGRHFPVRPPWAVAEAQFVEICTACGACVAACPHHLIKTGRGHLPLIDFSAGACDFCGDCARACKTPALRAPNAGESVPPWQVRATVTGDCLAQRGVLCRSCGDHCEAGAIRFRLAVGGVATPRIDHQACTGCGACYRPCPTHAIVLRADPMTTS